MELTELPEGGASLAEPTWRLVGGASLGELTLLTSGRSRRRATVTRLSTTVCCASQPAGYGRMAKPREYSKKQKKAESTEKKQTVELKVGGVRGLRRGREIERRQRRRENEREYGKEAEKKREYGKEADGDPVHAFQ